MEFTAEQQEFIDGLVGSARTKARAKAETDALSAQTKTNEEAEKANLEAKEEWQKLSATHEARVKVLEPLEAEVIAYRELISGMLKDRVKILGDVAKKAVNALPETINSLEKLTWLNENIELFQERRIVGTPVVRKGLRKGKKSAADVGHIRKRM